MLKDVLANIRDLVRWKSTFEPEIDIDMDKRLRRMIAFGHEEAVKITANLRKEYKDMADDLDFAIIGTLLIETAAVSKVDESKLDEFTKVRFKSQIEVMTEENLYHHLESFDRDTYYKTPKGETGLPNYLVAAQSVAEIAFKISKVGYPPIVGVPSSYYRYPRIKQSLLLMKSVKA